MSWLVTTAAVALGVVAHRLVGALRGRKYFLARALEAACKAEGGTLEESDGGFRCTTRHGTVVHVESLRHDGSRKLRMQGRYALYRGPAFGIRPAPEGGQSPERLRWPRTAFDREFEVVSDNEQAMRTLLTSKVRGWLATWAEHLTAQSDGRLVNIWLPAEVRSKARVRSALRLAFRFTECGLDSLEEAAAALDGVLAPGPRLEVSLPVRTVVAARDGEPPALVASFKAPNVEDREAPVPELSAHLRIVGGEGEFVWNEWPSPNALVAGVRHMASVVHPTSAYR